MTDRIEIVRLESGTPDRETVLEVVALVNDVYATAEAGMWRPGTPRTDADDVAAAIRAGELLTARRGDDLLGVVRTGSSERLAWLGMLAVRPQNRGAGIGRQLVDAAESRAAEAGAIDLQLEVLTPADGSNASKVELDRWYRRLGYSHLRDDDLAAHHADLAGLLALPCALRVYRKRVLPR